MQLTCDAAYLWADNLPWCEAGSVLPQIYGELSSKCHPSTHDRDWLCAESLDRIKAKYMKRDYLGLKLDWQVVLGECRVCISWLRPKIGRMRSMCRWGVWDNFSSWVVVQVRSSHHLFSNARCKLSGRKNKRGSINAFRFVHFDMLWYFAFCAMIDLIKITKTDN